MLQEVLERGWPKTWSWYVHPHGVWLPDDTALHTVDAAPDRCWIRPRGEGELADKMTTVSYCGYVLVGPAPGSSRNQLTLQGLMPARNPG